MILQDVPVPADAVLGEVGKGHKVAFNVLNFGRFKLGAMTSGGAKSALADAAKYATTRKQFGVPIATFGAIRHKLGEMTAREYALESLMYRTAGLIDETIAASGGTPAAMLQALEEFAIEASIAKVYGSEVVDYVVDESVQIHGGNGFVADYPVERQLPRCPRQPHLRGHQRDQPPAHPRHAHQEGREGRPAADGRGQGAAGRDHGAGGARPRPSDRPLAAEFHAVTAFKKVAALRRGRRDATARRRPAARAGGAVVAWPTS